MPRAAEGRPPALVVRGVSKTFRVPEERVHTLKERMLHPARRPRFEIYRALDDVSFVVREGEFFGLAGRNGSGKSTLLKCIAGIYGAEGEIWRRGRLATLIELGVGFNLELAARDNVVLNGIMLGLSPREARERYDSVIDFAELRQFQDLKLKNYSSGMHVRLAFSVAVHVDADILLVDEILAVGDAAFQQKCFEVFDRLRAEGKTVIYVSHDMNTVTRFCHRALLLERGSMVHLGAPDDVAEKYLEINFGRDPAAAKAAQRQPGSQACQVLDVWVQNERGERQLTVAHGERIELCVLTQFAADIDEPQMSVYVQNEEQQVVIVASTIRAPDRVGDFRAGEQAVFSFSFDNVLAPGRYRPVVFVAQRGLAQDPIDRFAADFTFLVTATRPLGGMVEIPVEVDVTRVERVLAGEMPA